MERLFLWISEVPHLKSFIGSVLWLIDSLSYLPLFFGKQVGILQYENRTLWSTRVGVSCLICSKYHSETQVHGAVLK